MKRSTLLNEIQWLILESDCIDVPNSNCIDEIKLAKLILDLVESAGMLPPKIENVECLSNNGYLSLDAALKRGLNQWESEDE